jgi:3-oxoacyl-[acyl-carrier-protein] synthase II
MAYITNNVVITGIGCVGPHGVTVHQLWNDLAKNNSRIGEITSFDTSESSCKVGAELSKEFNPADFMCHKIAKRYELSTQTAIAASKQAMLDAGLDIKDMDPTRVGVAEGTSLRGLQSFELALNHYFSTC